MKHNSSVRILSLLLLTVFKISYAITWTFASSVEGWASRSSAAQVRWSGDGDGRLYMDTYGSDPGMFKDVSLSAASNNKIKMQVATYCPNTNCTLYFKRSGSTTVFTAKSLLFQSGNSWGTYEIDLTDVSEWTGTITQIRIDPSDNCGSPTSPGFIAFDWIEVNYVTPNRPDLFAIRPYIALLGNPAQELTRDPRIGEKIQFGLDFRVDNTNITSPTTVKLYLDGQLYWSQSYPYWNIGNKYIAPPDVALTWTVIAGSHQARWVLDQENRIAESYENNNEATRSWTTIQQFDLITGIVEFKNASGQPIQGLVGEQVYFYYRYSIAGSGVTFPFNIQCFLDGSLYETISNISGYGGNEYITHAVNPWIATAGSHNLEFFLDSANNIGESAENNNRSSGGYTTVSRTVDLLTPAINNTVTSDEIRLSWSNASPYYYEIMVDNNSGFGSPEVYIKPGNKFTACEYTIPGNTLTQNLYYWKVVAHYADGSNVSSSVGNFTYQPPTALVPYWTPLYRMHKAADSDHFYVTSDNHRQIAINSGFKDERIEGYLSWRRFDATDMVSIFRFYDNSKRSHYYTISETDRDNKIIAGLIYEGITGFAHANSNTDLVPLYYLRSNFDDFYTVSEFEKNNAVNAFGYTLIGILAYVSQTGENTFNLLQESQAFAGNGINTVNGNFNHYTKSSFHISGIGFPLSFEHVYNSMAIVLRSDLQPLGPGWSHSYLAYIDLAFADNTVAVCWPDGTIDLYNKNGSTYSPVLKSVYDEMTFLSSSLFEIKRKDQTVYVFQIPSGAPAGYPAMLKSKRDRNNNTLNCTYESSEPWRLLTVVDASGRILQLSYFTDLAKKHLLRQVSGPLNRIVSFDYDSDGLMSRYTNADGNVTQYFYDTSSKYDHILKQILLPKGNYIDNTYEVRKIKSQKFKGIGSSLSIDYQSNKTTVTDELGHSTSYDYNANHFVEKITDLTGSSGYEQAWYEDANNPSKPTRIRDRNGNLTYMSYDGKGNMLQLQSPTGTHTFTYDAMNNPLSYKDPKNKITQFNYDTHGNLISLVDPLSHTTQWPRLSNGLAESIINPLGHITYFTYDAYGNITSIRDPLNYTSIFDHDAGSRQIQSTNAKQQTVRYTYSNNDLIKTITDPMNGVTSYDYDPNENQLSITDAKSQATQWSYNDRDLLISTTSATGNRTSLTYNDDGSLSSRNYPGGPSASYVYDQSGRLQTINSSGYSCSFSYDANGNLLNASDNNGSISFNYDVGNRMVSNKDFYNSLVTYGYDAADHITSITYPGGKTVYYNYYDDGRLQSVRDWNNQTTIYTYRADGALANVQYPNGTRCIHSYDQADRLVGLRNETSIGQVISAYTYGLDELGNHISETIEEPFTAPSLAETRVLYNYDAANRIQSAGSDQFTFETNGNLRSQTGSHNMNFTWDWDKRLVKVMGDYSAEYTYDVFGHRRTATRNGTTVRYILDISGSMSQVLMEQDVNGVVLNYYVYGLGLISRIKADGTTHYYHYNNVGNTIAITDQAQSITHKYQYDPFGRTLQSQEADANLFRFVGQWGVMDEGNGLHFMRARYYDAVLGRFISEDQNWDTNFYLYSENVPIQLADPNGEIAINPINAFISSLVEFPSMFMNQIQASYFLITALKAENPYEREILLQLNSEYNNKVQSGVSSIVISSVSLFGKAPKNIKGSKAATKVFGKTGILKLFDMRTRYGIVLKRVGSYVQSKVKDEIVDKVLSTIY